MDFTELTKQQQQEFVDLVWQKTYAAHGMTEDDAPPEVTKPVEGDWNDIIEENNANAE